MFGLVKIAVASAALAAIAVSMTEAAPPAAGPGSRLIVEFEPVETSAAVRTIEVDGRSAARAPARSS